MFEVTPMFWQNGLIHIEKKRRGGEQRKAIHAGPWCNTLALMSLPICMVHVQTAMASTASVYFCKHPVPTNGWMDLAMLLSLFIYSLSSSLSILSIDKLLHVFGYVKFRHRNSAGVTQ